MARRLRWKRVSSAATAAHDHMAFPREPNATNADGRTCCSSHSAANSVVARVRNSKSRSPNRFVRQYLFGTVKQPKKTLCGVLLEIT